MTIHRSCAIDRCLRDRSMLARSIDGCANDGSIDRAARAIDRTDPSIAHNMHEQHIQCSAFVFISNKRNGHYFVINI